MGRKTQKKYKWKLKELSSLLPSFYNIIYLNYLNYLFKLLHAEFFGEISNHPGESAPLQSKLGTLRLLAFPKMKITFEREKILDCT